MTGAATLLARLDGVRSRGDGRWVARCPAHSDRSPSLSIREESDGRLLVHCFAGCGAGEVVASVGLSLSDLFSDAPQSRGPVRRLAEISPRQIVAVLAQEAQILAIAANDADLPNADRIAVAAGRVRRLARMLE